MTAFGRKQWIGIDGAPVTGTFTAHTPIHKEKMGLGIILTNDKISVFNQTSLSAIYSYRILISETRRLSFGLQGGFNNYTIRNSQLTSKVPNDPLLTNSDVSSFTPSFGAGIYYDSKKSYIGFSIPYLTGKIFQPKSAVINLRNYYFLTAGYIIDISNDVKLKPSFLAKYISGNPMQVDLNTNIMFREVFWFGLSYRSFNSLCFLTQVNITDQLRIGYSYDMSLGKLAGLNAGAHELMINYLFSFHKTKVVTPRLF
jgi:type IX secretion system PorP/SprF family membrane protein